MEWRSQNPLLARFVADQLNAHSLAFSDLPDPRGLKLLFDPVPNDGADDEGGANREAFENALGLQFTKAHSSMLFPKADKGKKTTETKKAAPKKTPAKIDRAQPEVFAIAEHEGANNVPMPPIPPKATIHAENAAAPNAAQEAPAPNAEIAATPNAAPQVALPTGVHPATAPRNGNVAPEPVESAPTATEDGVRLGGAMRINYGSFEGKGAKFPLIDGAYAVLSLPPAMNRRTLGHQSNSISPNKLRFQLVVSTNGSKFTFPGCESLSDADAAMIFESEEFPIVPWEIGQSDALSVGDLIFAIPPSEDTASKSNSDKLGTLPGTLELANVHAVSKDKVDFKIGRNHYSVPRINTFRVGPKGSTVL